MLDLVCLILALQNCKLKVDKMCVCTTVLLMKEFSSYAGVNVFRW